MSRSFLGFPCENKANAGIFHKVVSRKCSLDFLRLCVYFASFQINHCKRFLKIHRNASKNTINTFFSPTMLFGKSVSHDDYFLKF